jgi:hypothetical protein
LQRYSDPRKAIELFCDYNKQNILKGARHNIMKVKESIKNELITKRGILVPMGWDESGKVIAVGLSAIDEKDYLIDNSKKREKLLELIQREVEISGLLRDGKDGKKVIIVKRYKMF